MPRHDLQQCNSNRCSPVHIHDSIPITGHPSSPAPSLEPYPAGARAHSAPALLDALCPPALCVGPRSLCQVCSALSCALCPLCVGPRVRLWRSMSGRGALCRGLGRALTLYAEPLLCRAPVLSRAPALCIGLFVRLRRSVSGRVGPQRSVLASVSGLGALLRGRRRSVWGCVSGPGALCRVLCRATALCVRPQRCIVLSVKKVCNIA